MTKPDPINDKFEYDISTLKKSQAIFLKNTNSNLTCATESNHIQQNNKTYDLKYHSMYQ